MHTGKIAGQSMESQVGIGSDGSSVQSSSCPVGDERVNTRGAAQYLGISESTVRKYVSRRLLAHYKLGKLVRFATDDLDAWLLSRRVEAMRGDRK